MAKYRRGKKIEPAVLNMHFNATVGSALTNNYIDISQCASIVNRRFYRQGIAWVVSDIKIVNLQAATGGELAIGKLPETWTMANAWKKGFEAWREMNANALENAESVRARFEDFKIFADAQHHTNGYAANLLPHGYTNFATNTAIAGEWESSKYIIPNNSNPGFATEREIIATGASYPGNGASTLNAVSLIEGYAASRGLPYTEDPNAPADAADAQGPQPQNWMSAVFNEGQSQTDAVITDQLTENNKAPYPFEGDGLSGDTMYPGGANQLPGLQLHDFEVVSSTTVGRTTRLKGGVFPCGLMSIGTSGFPEGTSLVIQVSLVPGEHRGYMCTPMSEM